MTEDTTLRLQRMQAQLKRAHIQLAKAMAKNPGQRENYLEALDLISALQALVEGFERAGNVEPLPDLKREIEVLQREVQEMLALAKEMRAQAA